MTGSSTPTLIDRLRAEGLAPSSWSNGPNDTYPAHEHGYDKVLVVTDGSITFGLPASGTQIVLETGDRLDLPAETVHQAIVGPAGVTCLEAHLPRGKLEGLGHRPTGAW
jgi:quercetin dioxygenase-like cupin family protein